jgi:hypothetical protein
MADLPHPWDMYAQIQSKLSSLDTVNSSSWGLEAGLNHLCGLSGDSDANVSSTRKKMASASRRERHRRNLIAKNAEPDSVRIVATIEAANELDLIAKKMKPADFELLIGIANGDSYSVLSLRLGVRPDALRTRVSRLRSMARKLTEGDGLVQVAA